MKFQNKNYRLSLVDNDTHSGVKTIRFTKLRFITIAIATIVCSILLIYCLIAFTPLRNTIPGYPTVQVKKVAMANAMKIDSLESIITRWDLYAENLSRVLAGEATVNFDGLIRRSALKYVSDKPKSELDKQDSLLRERVQREEQFGLSTSAQKSLPMEGKHFFNPVKGVVSGSFDKVRHPGIDISTPAGSIVSAILDGTVIYSGWDEQRMYVIIIQHSDNLASCYSSCSRALKNSGDEVKAGTPIAMSGGAGSESKTDVLHLEIWNNGEPIDPARHLNY